MEIPYRTLGRNNVKVSLLGLGGYHIGKRSVSEEDSLQIIRTIIDRGVNFLDNCWDYNNGESETRMGKALRDGYRDKAFVMTKIDGRDKKTAKKQIDESIQRLGTNIDLLQIHEVIRMSDPEKVFGPNGAMEALLEAKDAGKIRYIGFTGHKSPEIHLKMLQTAFDHGFTFDTVQMPLNVIDAHFESFEKKVLPVLLKYGIGVIGMKPLGSGRIPSSGVVTAQECLRYAMSLPVSVIVTGIDTNSILNQALSVAEGFKPMSDEERSTLLAKTSGLDNKGSYELYKTTLIHDSTTTHPEWLG